MNDAYDDIDHETANHLPMFLSMRKFGFSLQVHVSLRLFIFPSPAITDVYPQSGIPSPTPWLYNPTAVACTEPTVGASQPVMYACIFAAYSPVIAEGNPILVCYSNDIAAWKYLGIKSRNVGICSRERGTTMASNAGKMPRRRRTGDTAMPHIFHFPASRDNGIC